jgi:multidrug efflux pump
MGIGMMQADGMALVFNPPPIMGLGTAGGFEVYLQNRVDGDSRKLNEVAQPSSPICRSTRNSPASAPSSAPPCRNCSSSRRAEGAGARHSAGQHLRVAAKHHGRAVRQRLQQGRPRLSRAVAGRGRLPHEAGRPDQGLCAQRDQQRDDSAVRRQQVKRIVGPEQVERFNGFVAAKIMGDSKPGISSGDAIKIVEQVAATLPAGYEIAWTGQAFQEKAAPAPPCRPLSSPSSWSS